MDNKDWQRKGNDFWDVVQDAVNSGNYQQLNQQVRATIDDTVEGIFNGMRGARDGFRSGMQQADREMREEFRNTGQSSRDDRYSTGRRTDDGSGSAGPNAWNNMQNQKNAQNHTQNQGNTRNQGNSQNQNSTWNQNHTQNQNYSQNAERKTYNGYGNAGQNFRGRMQNAEQELRNGARNAGMGFRNGMQGLGNEWRQAWMDAGRSTGAYRKSSTPGYQAGTRSKKEEEKQLPAVYMKNPPGQMSGTVMAVTGYTLTGVFALSGVSSALVLAVQPSAPAGIITAVMAAAAVGCLGMGILGSRTRKLIKRFRNYAKQIGNRAYCTIEELASGSGRDQADVVKDLRKMIDKKMFLQGHIDQHETCVIVTDDMYQQYLTVQQQAKERELLQKALEDQRAQLPEECQKILDEGQEYIQYIRKCNDDIPGEEISMKLSRLELIITRIFDEVGKNPALAGDLRKFMNYYLPTTRKLVDAYREMDQEPIVSENIAKTKKEIEDTLDTINQAFENLLNSFFEEKALDISSDISVLHTMLAQEGLTKKDFDLSKQ